MPIEPDLVAWILAVIIGAGLAGLVILWSRRP